jgi:Superinfection immunity protein
VASTGRRKGLKENTTSNSVLIVIAIAVWAFFFYILPAYVAAKRRHANTLAITVLCLLLGWTFIGWVAAMVWACTDNVLPEPTHSYTAVAATNGDSVITPSAFGLGGRQ